MAIYRYLCFGCRSPSKVKQNPSEFNPDRQIQCTKCNGVMRYYPTELAQTTVYDTRDKDMGKPIRRGTKEMIKERYNKHLRKYDAADIIDNHGVDDPVSKKLILEKKEGL